MTLISDGLTHQIRLAGNVLRVRYYSETYTGSVWDDSRSLAGSGTDLYISGVILKIDSSQGSEDQVLLEQGRIRYNDMKCYVNGSIQTTSGARIFTVAISGLNRVYRENETGIFAPQYFGTDIFKKLYLTEVPLGSLL